MIMNVIPVGILLLVWPIKKTGRAAPSAEEEKEAKTPPALISITLGIQSVSSLPIALNTQIATLTGI